MKRAHSVAAAAGLAAAGFLAAGCSANSGSATAGAAATTPAATSAATAGSGTHPTARPAGTPSSHQAQAAGGGTCGARQLRYALGGVTGSSAQRTQVVDLTNKGSAACTLEGFPGVDLDGVANGEQDFTWSLARQSARYSAVNLQPGQTGHFTVIYLPGTSASTDMSVAKLIITPPNDYTQAELTWNRSVVLQDGATHPGTFISPVVPGA